MEANASGIVHVHMMLQFAHAQTCGSSRFMLEGKRPNASTLDYLTEGLCRKKLQQRRAVCLKELRDMLDQGHALTLIGL